MKIKNIPLELKKLNQWVVWRMEEGERKMPYNPKTHTPAKSNDATTWGSFMDAAKAMQDHDYSGLGFVFSDNDPYCGIDLDDVRQGTQIEMWAYDIVSRFNSYAELSPSGSGIHIIIKGKVDKGRKVTPRIEVYSTERYFTFTGDVEDLTGEAWPVLPGQDQLELLLDELNVKKPVQIVKQYAESILDLSAPQGTRYERSGQVAGYLLSKIDPDLWDKVALPTFIRWCDEKCSPSLWKEQPDEVRKTWENIKQKQLQKGQTKIVGKQPDAPIAIGRPLHEAGIAMIEDRKLQVGAPKTGYPELDKLIKGFLPGHVYTMTGNTNVGKTSLACNFVERVRKQGKKSLYFALEPDVNVVEYLASCRTTKQFDFLTDDDLLYDDDLVRYFTKSDVPDLQSLVNIIDTVADEYSLVVIDHIGYFVTSQQNYIQEQSNVIKAFAQMAKQKRIAFLIITHINKGATRGKARNLTMDDISGSAAFKQDSTEVLLINRRENEDGTLSPRGTFHVAKTKSGPNGKFDLLFSERSAFIASEDEASVISIYRRGSERVEVTEPNKPVEAMSEEEVMMLW